jgi:hypothetical protein
LNLEVIKKAQDANAPPLGYHEEFMSKLDEYSESWREAAKKEKRI